MVSVGPGYTRIHVPLYFVGKLMFSFGVNSFERGV